MRASGDTLVVKMRQSALDQICSLANLEACWREILSKSRNKSSCGVDGVTIQQFDREWKGNLSRIQERLRKEYTFSRLRAIDIVKPDSDKRRIICIPTIADRVVQKALLRLMEPYAFKMGLVNSISYGFVKDPSGKPRGIEQARNQAKRYREQYPWVLKTDIQSFFDSIPRDDVFRRAQRYFRFRSIHPLIKSAICCEIDDRDSYIRRICRDSGIEPGKGLRQGMPLSPFFSSIVLKEFDEELSKRGVIAIEYADDIVAFGVSEAQCEDYRALIENRLAKVDLKLSKPKTALHGPSDPVSFLGLVLSLDQRGRAKLEITEDQIKKIQKKFTVYHDFSYVVSKNMTAFSLYNHLTSMKIGYRFAYGVADNHQRLYDRLELMVTNCMESAFSSVLGKNIVKRLTTQKRSFLGLP